MAQYQINNVFDSGSPVEKSELHYCIDTPEESAHLKVEDYEDDEYLICKSWCTCAAARLLRPDNTRAMPCLAAKSCGLQHGKGAP
jgi:hypothetical protein